MEMQVWDNIARGQAARRAWIMEIHNFVRFTSEILGR
jgi:hypothetical protein